MQQVLIFTSKHFDIHGSRSIISSRLRWIEWKKHRKHDYRPKVPYFTFGFSRKCPYTVPPFAPPAFTFLKMAMLRDILMSNRRIFTTLLAFSLSHQLQQRKTNWIRNSLPPLWKFDWKYRSSQIQSSKNAYGGIFRFSSRYPHTASHFLLPPCPVTNMCKLAEGHVTGFATQSLIE